MTVTASDGTDEADQTFKVTVVKNQGPQKVGTTPDQTVKVKGNTILGLGTYFDSVDGDTLTYTVSSADKAKATVSVDKNGLLTIAGVAIGTTTITAMVTESDPAKLTATQTFDVTVSQSNRAPTAVGTIAAMTASVSKGNETLDASSYFSDADGDTLTYTATSSAVSKATVSVSGATVTITPVAAGPATITVKATDTSSTSATQTFTVTVVANQKPVAKGSIPAHVVTIGRGAGTQDVSGYFSDPDGDTLTYTASSSAASKAAVSVSDSTVTITPKTVGTATVTVTASDGAATATQTIAVTVQANSAPTTVGTIPNQTVTVGKNDISLDVSSYFSDPDGDTLTYSASSNATGKATVGVSGVTLTITAVAVGSATITVTASDGVANAAQTFSVTVKSAPQAVGSIPALTVSKSNGPRKRSGGQLLQRCGWRYLDLHRELQQCGESGGQYVRVNGDNHRRSNG